MRAAGEPADQLPRADGRGLDPMEIVVHFLGLLELYKQGLVELEQVATFGELRVRLDRRASKSADVWRSRRDAGLRSRSATSTTADDPRRRADPAGETAGDAERDRVDVRRAPPERTRSEAAASRRC